MLFSTIIAFLPLLAPAFAKIDPVIDKDLTSPWAGKVGPVPRFECMCDCGSPEASRQVTTELCESAIKLGRKREIRLMEDGSCAFWGLDVSMFPEEIGSSWGKEICTEKGCNATSTCDYISCSGIERTKWTAPEPEQGEETAEQDDA
ncbi:hypothetical protein TWF106_004725 [Orbilia oligospora]|uniref:Uncharacterized protein n=1 Tax=Orbilia oligospora TaxID=2813651 RepID=A0A6G1MH54_ORBOL|nr:hypothetical protein TWF788_007528 [Orbilia oligospora]KAF3198276.1 hypothetical protein TWF106_004725 [Orbilia oligospora]KAF3206653.1 hypothetical protein TWF679_008697 [Orbilia oligospora]KAF3229466.1 hypothetical protein TWF191_001188 [Orbilia oligospora]KAF3258389.1 hypothetical protein TWF192_000520 [Orbilia oligospora]